MKHNILIVCANYYIEVSNNLLRGATDNLENSGYEYEIIFSPGCFEIPFLVKQNIDKYIGFIVLGCVIRGETYHFEVVSNECTRKIMDLNRDISPFQKIFITKNCHCPSILTFQMIKYQWW